MEEESDWEIFWNGEGVWWVESFSSIFVCEFFGGFEILFYMIYFSVECLYYDFIIIFRLEIFEIIELKCFSFSKRIIIFVDRLPNFNSIKIFPSVII